MINVSRSFGSRIESLDALTAALVEFASMAASRLRKQGSAASAMRVYARTSPFDTKNSPYAKTITVPFSQPASDVRIYARAATQAARAIFKSGVRFSKAGVLLMGVQPASAMSQQDLFGYDNTSQDRLMSTLDEINSRFGRDTVKLGRTIALAGWKPRSDSLSPAYSCRLSDLKTVF
jgi:DNA polymerase V